MNIINEFFVSFILIKLYFKFKVCRKIKFPLLWKFYFSKWKFYFSADRKVKKGSKEFLINFVKKVYSFPSTIGTNKHSSKISFCKFVPFFLRRVMNCLPLCKIGATKIPSSLN